MNKKGFPTLFKVNSIYEKSVALYKMEGYVEVPLNATETVQVMDISLDITNMELGHWNVIGVKERVNEKAIFYGEIPEKYHNDDFICEHCNNHRKRNKVIILKHKETGEEKQVGNTCLKDFVGVEVSRFNSLLNELQAIVIQKLYIKDNLPQQAYLYDVKRVLHIAYKVMQKYGYVKKWDFSKGDVPFNYRTTKSRVIEIYNKCEIAKEDENFLLEDLDTNTIKKCVDTYKDFVKKNGESNFTENVLNLLSTPYVSYKFLSYIVFVPSFYINACKFEVRKQKEQEKQNQERKSINNEYLANIGDKVSFEGTLERVNGFEGTYGYTYVYNFKTTDNHVVVWFSTKNIQKNEGDKVSVSGTVKKLNDYNGIKQTVITRCKVK